VGIDGGVYVDAPRTINCFSARSLPRETSSSMESHIPFESVSLLGAFLLVEEDGAPPWE
jgi:hypothetical protein